MLKDSEIFQLNDLESRRQRLNLSLIASENIVSPSVRAALSTTFTNKTVEGYPGKRYHAGCEVVDRLEELTIARTRTLFDCNFANVQPHSCSQANQAALLSLVPPGGKILSMELKHGGHLSHGVKQSLTGKIFDVAHYGVNRESQLIDYDEVERLAHQHRPQIIIVGSSSYSRVIDFLRFREIADSCNSLLLADIAHVAGLIAAKAYPSPIPFADITTTSMYKTLRGPRGGLIMSRKKQHAQALNKAIFPGIQGTPCLNTLAAKAVCLGEAAQPEFLLYGAQIVENSRYFAKLMTNFGIPVVSGGTDSHIVLLDLRPSGLSGNMAAEALERCGILCNMNLIPFDDAPPVTCSGIRFGFAAATTLGLTCKDIEILAELIYMIFSKLKAGITIEKRFEKSIREKISVMIAEKKDE